MAFRVFRDLKILGFSGFFGGVDFLGSFRLSELLGFGVQSLALGIFEAVAEGTFEQLSSTVLSLNPRPSTLKPLRPNLLGCCVGGVGIYRLGVSNLRRSKGSMQWGTLNPGPPPPPRKGPLAL